MTIRTHPAYPLNDTNRLLYKRMQRARNARRRTQDQAQRLALGYRIADLTEQIRRMGMR